MVRRTTIKLNIPRSGIYGGHSSVEFEEKGIVILRRPLLDYILLNDIPSSAAIGNGNI